MFKAGRPGLSSAIALAVGLDEVSRTQLDAAPARTCFLATLDDVLDYLWEREDQVVRIFIRSALKNAAENQDALTLIANDWPEIAVVEV